MHPRNTLTFVKDDFQIGKNEEPKNPFGFLENEIRWGDQV